MAPVVVEMLEGLNLTIINGRCQGDYPGNYTFLGNMGSSAIDLVMCNDLAAEEIHRLEVLEFVSDDHQPVSIKSVANKVGLTSKAYCSRTNKVNKPWFDKECTAAKMKAKIALREMRMYGFDERLRQVFLVKRRHYRKIYKERKSNYYATIREDLCNSKSTRKFLAAVRKLKPKSLPENNTISEEVWIAHFEKLLGNDNNEEEPNFIDCRHPEMDKCISLHEVIEDRRKLKCGKSPGADGIANEFLKALPESFQSLFLLLFNQILQGQKPPSAWGD
ncbi:unnamed protein product, partial [Allacma fusca]